MKALKEKRINLRSLWRRSLVILSLLALVFAACGDSSSSGSSNIPTGIRVLSGPTNMSYMGLPVDLTGVTLEVTYANGATRIITDTNRMRTEPAIAHGFFLPLPSGVTTATATDWTFTGNSVYQVLYSHDGVAFSTDLNINFPASGLTGVGTARTQLSDGRSSNSVIPILRTQLTVVRPTAPLSGVAAPGTGEHFLNQEFLTASGFQVTGAHTMRQQYYVDDTPVFAGLSAEARFMDGTVQVIPLNRDTVEWALHPHYDNGNETGSGSLFITVGRHPDFNPAVSISNQASVATPADLRPDPGVTVVLPVPRMFHITAFEFDTEPNFDPFFYFDADVGGSLTDSQWARRSAGVVFRMVFSNGTVRTMPIREAFRQNEVWFNANPGGYLSSVPRPGEINFAGPFWIQGIQANSLDGTHFFNNRDPKITYYYRGHRLDWTVPVLTRFQSLSVTPESLEVNMRRRDNDFRLATDAVAFADMITVTATFSAFSDPAVTGDVVLTYSNDLANANWGVTDARGRDIIRGFEDTVNAALTALSYTAPITPVPNGGMRLGRVYTMNFGRNDNPHIGDPRDFDDILHSSSTDWGVSNNPQNNGRLRRVDIYYNTPIYTYTVGTPFTQDGRQVAGRINVQWSNID